MFNIPDIVAYAAGFCNRVFPAALRRAPAVKDPLRHGRRGICLRFQPGADCVVIVRIVGIEAGGAVLYTISVDIISTALIPQMVQGAEAEQTVEPLRVVCQVAGEELTFPVLKEGVVPHISRRRPSRSSSWRAYRRWRRRHPDAPEQRACSGRTCRPRPSCASRIRGSRTTWS